MPTKESTRGILRDYGVTIFAAIAVALFIRFFVLEAYRIPSSTMRPSLEAGDTIFVAKWPFGLRIPGFNSTFTRPREPRRGEVVVFSLSDGSHRDYIKRVVGLQGDTVALKQGHLYVNGKSMEVAGSENANCAKEKTVDGYVYPVCFETPTLADFGPTAVPKGSVFVVGDLRKQAPLAHGDIPIQSWGIEPLSSLRGSALWIWLSVQPQNGESSSLFPTLRLNRMFRRIR